MEDINKSMMDAYHSVHENMTGMPAKSGTEAILKPQKPAKTGVGAPQMSGSMSSSKFAMKPMKPMKPINTTKTESYMDKQRYHSMTDAYRSMYEAKGYQEGGEVGKDGKHIVVGRPALRAAVVLPKPSVTKVNIEVNPQTEKVGDVEKAYYTFPAGFDPTNREDVADPSANKKVEYKEEVVSEGDIQYPKGPKQKFTKDKSDPKVAAGRKAAKDMGLLKSEEHNISAGDMMEFMIDSGITESMEGAEAMYHHMSSQWRESIIDGMIEEGKKGRCWKGYKPTPGKEPYSDGSCVKA